MERERNGGENDGGKGGAHNGGPDDATFGLPLFRPALRLDALADRIRAAAARIERGDFSSGGSDGDAGAAVVLPLFEQLGWDLADATLVVPRFGTRAGVVDYALCHPAGTPRVLVNIGPLPPRRRGGGASAREAHPFDDPRLRALQLAISGDGREWRFHFPAGSTRLDKREFARADLVGDKASAVAEVLDTYVNFFALRAGWAFRVAEGEYRQGAFPAHAPRAWRRALAGSEVLDRFLAEMMDASGVSADPNEAEAFVRRQVEALPWTPSPPDAAPFRRVAVGDKVWVYDLASDDLECYYPVAGDPDFERNEVTAESPLGRALLGAREGEMRETQLPDGTDWVVRVVLVTSRAADDR